jgi:hypothetical protein
MLDGNSLYLVAQDGGEGAACLPEGGSHHSGRRSRGTRRAYRGRGASQLS